MLASEHFDERRTRPRLSLIGLYGLLIAANLGAWAWAAVLFEQQPIYLGTALLAYTLGLRHAVDADHIAAIDNVTRKLIQEGRRPISVGFFFALGHSAVVAIAAAVIAVATTELTRQTGRLARRRPSNACGLVTSCTRWRSM